MAVDKQLSAMLNINKLIHEPARLVILSILYNVENADFLYIRGETGLTNGNLSTHLSKLEDAGYINIEKTYKGKTPLTLCTMTDDGKQAFQDYLHQIQQFVTSVLS